MTRKFHEILDAAPAPSPQAVLLQGGAIRLEKLAANYLDRLYDALHGASEEELWRYIRFGPFARREDFRAQFLAFEAGGDPYFFAVLDAKGDEVLGAFALMRIDRPNRVIEVGTVLFSPALQRTRAATEADYLLARHVFEDLGYRRYEWKCDDRNARSKNAALRLGFAFEGLFRQHMIIKGENRDTAWFAIIDRDWPRLRAAFEAWLDAANFDGDGRQKRPLAALRG